MKKLLTVFALSVITIYTSHTSWATVGGRQYLEFLGYEPSDKKVYLLRHYEDGRGRLPQLYYFDLQSKNPSKLITVQSIYRHPKTGKIDIDQYEDNSPFTNQLAAISKRLIKLRKLDTTNIKFASMQIKTAQAVAWYDQYTAKPDAQKTKITAYHYRYQLITTNSPKTQSLPQQATSFAKDLQLQQAFSIPNQPYVIASVSYLGDQFETGYQHEDAVLLLPKR